MYIIIYLYLVTIRSRYFFQMNNVLNMFWSKW